MENPEVESPERGSEQQKDREPGLPIQRYLHILLKRKWLVLAVFVLVSAAGALWTFSRTPIYRAKAGLILDNRAPQVLGKEVREVIDTSMTSFWRNKEYLQTQVRIIRSAKIARLVIERLDLLNNDAFWPKQDEGAKQQPRTVKAALRLLGATLRANAVPDSHIIEIAMMHRDPALAARIANEVSQAFRDQSLDYKHSSTAGAAKWLANQLDDLKQQLEKAELALHEFKKSHNIISVSLEDKQNLIMSRIRRINDALTTAQMKRRELGAYSKMLAQAEKQDPMDVSIPEVVEDPAIRSLKVVIRRARTKLRKLDKEYGPKWLAKQEQAAQDAEKDLRQAVKTKLASMRKQYTRVRRHEASLAADLQKSKDEAFKIKKHEVKYSRLKRQKENTEKLYGVVLARLKESNLSSQLRVSNIRTLERAVVPAIPVKPNVQLGLALAAFLGMLLGMAAAFIVDALDNTVKSSEDVENIPGVTFLGVMPRIPGAPVVSPRARRADPNPTLDLIVHRQPKSAVAESCRNVRTNLLFSSPDTTLRTIAITSPAPREGKSTTAVSLAIAMAQAGNSTVILDTDMRRSRLHKIFGVSGTEGITNVLLGDGKLEDVVKSTEIPNLYVLPCGPTPPNPAEICQSDRFKQLLDELEKRYDRVMLDTPPVMVVTDAVVLSTLVDGVMLVSRSNQTSRQTLRAAARQIQDVKGNILGCVINDVNLEQGGYGYYRYRRYGYRYGYNRYGYYAREDEEEATS